jgi:hypothetical protein
MSCDSLSSGRKVATGKLGKGGRDVGSNSETFRWNPVGNQSHPVELASSRKRVLRGGQRWSLRSVDSECLGPAIEPRKITCSWEPLSSLQRGPRRRAVMAWHVGPAGVQEQGISTRGFSRNLRDPNVSTGMAGWGYRLTNPRPAGTVSPCGSETRHGTRGSVKRRKRSAA